MYMCDFVYMLPPIRDMELDVEKGVGWLVIPYALHFNMHTYTKL